MKKIPALLPALALVFLLCACGKAKTAVPALHTIEYDTALDTLDDEYGSDAFDHSLDHADTLYYTINDFYNMKSGGSLHILPNFRTYQQTTEYSCGCASALMVLTYYGCNDYNELEICDLAGTDTSKIEPEPPRSM